MDPVEQQKQNIEKFKALLDRLEGHLKTLSDEGLRTFQCLIEVEISRRAQKKLGAAIEGVYKD